MQGLHVLIFDTDPEERIGGSLQDLLKTDSAIQITYEAGEDGRESEP